MSEQITVTCDRCKGRIGTPKLNRARIRWAREDGRQPTDYCLDCSSDLQVFLGIRAPDPVRLPASPARKAPKAQARIGGPP